MKKYFYVALSDMANGAMQWPLWRDLALRDIRLRYARTTIGPFWMTLSTGLFTLMFGLIYANLFHQDMHGYLPYLTAGYLAWMFLATIVTESCSVFTLEKQAINNQQFPYSILIYRLLFRNLIVFGHNLVILIGIYVIFGLPLSWNVLWLIPSLGLLCLNGMWIGLFLGTLCARFRDIQQVITSFLQIILFVTPIFWKPEMLGPDRMIFIDANVIYHVVSIVRDSLLGLAPSSKSFGLSLALAIVGITTTLWFFGRFRKRVPFWV